MNRLIDRFLPRETHRLVYEDESWFSRYQMPRLRSFSPLTKPFRMPVHPRPPREQKQALALYGALELPHKQVVVQWSDVQPASQPTWTFLKHLVAQQPEKRWLVIFWDNASFHKSKCLMQWIRGYNRHAGKRGLTRIVPYRLPKGSPWLNPIEPHWLHCKRAVYSVEHPLTPEQLRQRVHDYFATRNKTILLDS